MTFTSLRLQEETTILHKTRLVGFMLSLHCAHLKQALLYIAHDYCYHLLMTKPGFTITIVTPTPIYEKQISNNLQFIRNILIYIQTPLTIIYISIISYPKT